MNELVKRTVPRPSARRYPVPTNSEKSIVPLAYASQEASDMHGASWTSTNARKLVSTRALCRQCVFEAWQLVVDKVVAALGQRTRQIRNESLWHSENDL
jgi:hypothetical protein